MAQKLQDELRRLCCQYGWSYGIYWRLPVGESELLTVGCSYYESQLGNMMPDVLNHVHKVGKGVVGVAALDGRSNWVFLDTHFKEYSFHTSANNFKDDGTWSLQFLAGIKTISILPVQPFGVLEFGSCQKIMESVEFINYVKETVDNIDFLSELFVCEDSQAIGEIHDPFGVSSSVVIAGDSFSGYQEKGTDSIYNNSFNSVLPVQQYHWNSVIPSNYTVDFRKSSSMTVDNVYSLTNNSSLVSKHRQFSSNDDIIATMEQQLLKMIGSRELTPGIQPTAILGNMVHHMSGGDSCVTSVSNHNTGFNDARSSRGQMTNYLPSSTFTSQCSRKVLPHESCFPVKQNIESVSFCALSEDLMAEFATPSHSKQDAVNNLEMDNFLKHENEILTRPRNSSSMATTISSSLVGDSCDLANASVKELPDKSDEVFLACLQNSVDGGLVLKENYPDVRSSVFTEHNLYDVIDLDLPNCNQVPCNPGHIIIPEERTNLNALDCIPQLDVGVMRRPQEDIFSSLESDQLLDCVTAGNSSANTHRSSANTVNSAVFRNAHENQCSSNINIGNIPFKTQFPSVGLPNVSSSMYMLPECQLENTQVANDVHLKSQLSSWIDDCYSMNAPAITHSKKPEEQSKLPRKRARPGESARPRPKDRQLIQDRVKELRDIVPNGAKCSIDALLDRTIKHMLYLQNVTTFAEKIKQTDESKIIGDENGVVLRDNTNGGGGATWAFEVAGQTMVCPIIVEDLSPPGQMLVELLCEEHGFFLEIADIIKGFGLTILKGVIEVHDSKIWAKFLVEANREVTRMEIFLSLVHLLQQTCNANNVVSKQPSRVEMESGTHKFQMYNQSPLPIPISLPDRLQ